MSNVVLSLNSIKHAFRQGGNKLEVLRNIDLEVHEGELIALIGPSGAGKSTLLHITGLLESADSGEVIISGEPCNTMNDEQRTQIRREYLGFVYQHHCLLPEFSALENIIIPQMIGGSTKSLAKKRGLELLELMGLSERQKHRPARLSGGEQQRIAIARALANGPRLLLADEPTGNLDPETACDVFKLLMNIVRSAGLAAIIVTHNKELADSTDRKIKLHNGRLIEPSTE